MEIERIILQINEIAAELENIAPSAKWFLFGSVTKGKLAPNDIDLLIVYQKEDDRIILRNGLECLLAKESLHLLLMLESEEAETAFIKLQGAIQIYPFLNDLKAQLP